MTAQLVFSSKFLAAAATYDLTLVDIGARASIDNALAAIAPAVIAVGFEPDPAEARRLREQSLGAWRAVTIIEAAIANEVGRKPLRLAQDAIAASLLEHNPEMLDRFGRDHLHRTCGECEVNTTTLDALYTSGELTRIDLLKIDVEGAELSILESADKVLRNCCAIKVEVSFVQQRIGQPIASDIVAFLTQHGFQLFDAFDAHRWRRRPLPAHPYRTSFKMPYSRGQLVQCDLLFFKQPILDLEMTLRLVIIASALGYFDAAVQYLRASPSVAELWMVRHGSLLEQDLMTASEQMGRRATFHALRAGVRSLVPLVKAAIGRLGYAEPTRPY